MSIARLCSLPFFLCLLNAMILAVLLLSGLSNLLYRTNFDFSMFIVHSINSIFLQSIQKAHIPSISSFSLSTISYANEITNCAYTWFPYVFTFPNINVYIKYTYNNIVLLNLKYTYKLFPLPIFLMFWRFTLNKENSTHRTLAQCSERNCHGVLIIIQRKKEIKYKLIFLYRIIKFIDTFFIV